MARHENGRRSQQDRAASTRGELVRVARRLFAERGYAQVSAEQIVAAAGLTRGALYHHFRDKTELFRTVFEEVEAEVTERVAAAAAAAGPVPPAPVLAALGRFLDLCQTPEVLRIALTDAPAVLGWQAWREIEARHGLRLIAGMLTGAGAIPRPIVPAQRTGDDHGRPEPVPLLVQLVFSAVIEAALQVAHAADPRAARQEAEQALRMLFVGPLSQAG
ncbi:MAG: TetR/AcrR family transcriptional regulator [Micromonosporaceae bacterium]|nr:TetR/AcrR family transcriptional regulator [Micromonosporaceae bacterium]